MSDQFELRVPIPKRLRTSIGPDGPVYRLTPEAMQDLADQINKKAVDRRMMGQIDPPGDGKTRLARVSHVVLPTAKVLNDELRVEIEVLDTDMGRQLGALLTSGGFGSCGALRGVGATIEDVCVSSVDVNLDPYNQPHRTVLDDIVDAIEESEKTDPA